MLALVLLLFLSRPYHVVTISQMSANVHTHVQVTGTVTAVRAEADGDTHIRLSDGKDFIIAECIPMLPCPHVPKLGDKITIRGISRYDKEHGWYEIHPVEQLK